MVPPSDGTRLTGGIASYILAQVSFRLEGIALPWHGRAEDQQIPANLALHYIRPRLFFPACTVIWAGLTMVTASTQRPESIMVGWTTALRLCQLPVRVAQLIPVQAIRFFQGVFEATTFVGTHYIFGSWYTEREMYVSHVLVHRTTLPGAECLSPPRTAENGPASSRRRGLLAP